MAFVVPGWLASVVAAVVVEIVVAAAVVVAERAKIGLQLKLKSLLRQPALAVAKVKEAL